MKLFKEIGVEVPQSYKQIEQTLEEVKKLLKHYEEQTRYLYLKSHQAKKTDLEKEPVLKNFEGMSKCRK